MLSKNTKVALITGVTGQDGSYLSEYLLDIGYEVHGVIRRSSVFTTQRIDHLMPNQNFKLHHGDLNDSSNLSNLVSTIQPDEIYHLGAQSHVGVSFEVPEYTGDVSGLGTIRLLNAIKSLSPESKLYNASTSEMFGGFPGTTPQNELTAFHPRSPYGAAKLYAHWISINYRESFDLFVSNGILFNHESPRRGETFVTRKITRHVAAWAGGIKTPLRLGNLDAIRDWGFAGEYVQAMHLMLQQENPSDFVIATGQGSTVRSFVEIAFRCVSIDLEWEGQGLSEIGIDKATGETLVVIDPRYFRPSEVDILIGDASKAHNILGWTAKVGLQELCQMMVRNDLKR
jgi:GDPmannose 4,6-dehydratase